MCSCHDKTVLADALDVLNLEDGDVVDWVAAHDRYCARYSNQCCDCQPRICFKTTGAEFVVDEHGTLTALYLN